MMRRMLRDPSGMAVIEFALLAPAFFAFIFLVIEGGRMIWTQQVLQQTAVASARCLGVQAADCDSADAAETWAIANALKSGVRLPVGAVEASASTTCNDTPGMSRVHITNSYSNVVGSILPSAPGLLDVTGCYPRRA